MTSGSDVDQISNFADLCKQIVLKGPFEGVQNEFFAEKNHQKREGLPTSERVLFNASDPRSSRHDANLDLREKAQQAGPDDGP